MRFLRVGPAGSERPAVLDTHGVAYDLTPLSADIDGVFLAGDGVERTRAALAEGALPRTDLTGQRTGAPLARPGNVVRSPVEVEIDRLGRQRHVIGQA
ncbi:hypothetical protein ACFVY1_43315 [Streptomyces sp. NPDC058293]|uniref:hypothetical protein n=1 Tax=unclassified Streptomyces TaxID=2593676 RepID=UPI0033AC9C71